MRARDWLGLIVIRKRHRLREYHETNANMPKVEGQTVRQYDFTCEHCGERWLTFQFLSDEPWRDGWTDDLEVLEWRRAVGRYAYDMAEQQWQRTGCYLNPFVRQLVRRVESWLRRRREESERRASFEAAKIDDP